MAKLIPNLILKNYAKDIVYGNFQAVTLFQDIAGFTAMTEKLMKQGKVGAEVLSLIINQIFEMVIRIIYENRGFISTFAGDAFTAIFPSDDIAKACQAACDIQKYFAENPVKKTQLGEFNLGVRQGLSYGRVDWGIVGGDSYRTFYFRGEAVDGCAISEHHSDEGEIIIDSRILEKLPLGQNIFKEKTAYYYLMEEKNFQSIKWDEIDILQPIVSSEDDPELESIRQEAMKSFFPALDRKEGLKAEFKDLTSVFLSFDEPETFEKLDLIVIKILKLANDFGGYLSLLDFGDKGSLMLILFGAPIAYEDNNLRAADFATNIKSIFGNKVRLGINFGTAFTGYVGSTERATYTALGDVINLSSRFMSAAKNGQILISQKVCKAIEREFKTEFIETREFKGKRDKIGIYELTERIYFEDEGLHTGHFVGRKKELKKLDELCQPFFKNQFAGLIYVYGVAGIGKSRLLFEFTNPLIDEEKGIASIIVLQTDGILRKGLNPFTTHFLQYFNISQADSEEEKKNKFETKLNELLEHPKLVKASKSRRKNNIVKEAVEHLTSHRAILGALIGIHWPGSLYEELDSQSRFIQFLAVIKSFLILQANIRPLILVIEDSYDIDEDSKLALDELSTNIQKVPLVIIASCRLADDGSELEFLKKNKGIQKKMTLTNLSDQEGAELIKSLLAQNIHPVLAQFILERTGNNPLYIEEFCAYLLERKLIEEENGEYVLTSQEADIPEGISSIMVSRIDRLPNQLRKVVQTAAVLGRKFNTKILAELTQKKPEELEVTLEEGIKQNLWQQLNEGYYQFSQPMIQQAAYSMQLKEDLKTTHKNAAKLFEKYYSDDSTRFARIGRHFELAEITGKTIQYYLKAAESAHTNHRFEEALEIDQKLIRLLEINEAKIDVYARMAEIHELRGSIDDAYNFLLEGIKISKKLGAELRGSELKVYMSEILQKQSEFKKAIEIIDGAIDAAIRYQDDPLLSKARINLGKVYLNEGMFGGAVKNLSEAYSLKKKLKDESGKGLALYYMGVAKRKQNKFDEAMSYYKRSQKSFELTQNTRYGTYPLYDMAVVYRCQSQLKKSEKYFEQCSQVYKDIGYPSGESGVALNLGIIHSLRGDHKKAVAEAKRSLQISQRIGEKAAASYSLFVMGVFAYRMKKFEEAIRHFKEALTLMWEIKAKTYYGYVLSFLSCTYVKQGKPDKAIKAAFYHIRGMTKIKSDVENGRTYMGLAMALTSSEKRTALTQKRLSEILKLTQVKDQKNLADVYFNRAIEVSREAGYLNTLIPALCFYSCRLIEQGVFGTARGHLEEARAKMEEAGLNCYMELIKGMEKKLSEAVKQRV